MYKTFLLAACLMSLSAVAQSAKPHGCQTGTEVNRETFTDKKFLYTILSDEEVSVSVYRDTIADVLSGDSILRIPAKAERNGRRYDVTSIAKEAFYGCDNIKHIYVPEGVEDIGKYAFSRCLQLKSVHIPSTVAGIEDEIFFECPQLSSITIDGKNEDYDSRDNCNAIIDKRINALVAGCRTTVIPKSVTIIGYGAFACCPSLREIIIPEGVTAIEAYAFNDCENLESITLPNSLQRLGALGRCSSLKRIVVPGNVSDIDAGVFYGCLALQEIVVDKGNERYDSRDGCNGIVETEANRLVAACKNTRITESVTAIGELAFFGTMLTSVNIPATVSSIEDGAFAGNDFVTSITVCKDNPRYYSPDGSNVVMEKGTDRLIAGCFSSIIPPNTKVIAPRAFWMQPMPRTVILPEGVERIGEYAFSQCKGMSRIVIPSSIRQMDYAAFEYNKDLSDVVWNGSVETITSSLFANCPNLYYINLPSGVKTIKSGAFYGCKNLNYVIIPATVTNIEKGAFEWCPVKRWFQMTGK